MVNVVLSSKVREERSGEHGTTASRVREERSSEHGTTASRVREERSGERGTFFKSETSVETSSS